MSSHDSVGIPSNPVIFRDDVPMPPNPEGNIDGSQNLWHSIENNQKWAAINVLGVSGQAPYREPSLTSGIRQQIEVADKNRVAGDRYSDARNLGSFGAFFMVNDMEKLLEEFRDLSVLDIGSGAAALSNDLRREAGAKVIELDFSYWALQAASSVMKGQGSRVLADGTRLPVRDAVFDRTVSIFATSVHTNTVGTRLKGLTEMLRVTKEGGRAFIFPLIGGMVLRQHRWHFIQSNKHDPTVYNADVQAYEAVLRQEAALDFAVTDVIRTLISNKTIKFTPILTQEQKGNTVFDCIGGIFDVEKTLAKPQADELIAQSAAQFS